MQQSPRGAWAATPEAADEGAVDVDERRDPEPPAERRPLLAAAASRLSPVQAAWRAYVVHSLHNCPVCRRADGSPCDVAEALYRAYRELGNAALDRLAGKASPPRQ